MPEDNKKITILMILLKSMRLTKPQLDALVCVAKGMGFPIFIVGNGAANLKFAALQNRGWLWD